MSVANSYGEQDELHGPGDVIAGKYRLERKLGEGAMGTVWKATNLTLGVHVAIKLLLPSSMLPILTQRFLREARAAAMVTHPGIVRVFDYGETERGEPFIVMEFLAGEDFRDVLVRRGKLSAVEAVSMLLPVASAMDAAHERGIVHRDLKPENIFFAYDDGGSLKPKVVDFGIARFTWEASAGGTGAVVIGTLGYMAPEQALALATIDHRADIWAFCSVVYEAIAGSTPFPMENLAAGLDALISSSPPSLVGTHGVDTALFAIIQRGLHKDPQQRWRSMRELGRELGKWMLAKGVIEDVSGGSIRRLWFLDAAPVESTPPVNATLPIPLVQKQVESAIQQALSDRGEDADRPLPSSLGGAALSPNVRARLPRRSRWGLGLVALAGLTFIAWVGLGGRPSDVNPTHASHAAQDAWNAWGTALSSATTAVASSEAKSPAPAVARPLDVSIPPPEELPHPSVVASASASALAEPKHALEPAKVPSHPHAKLGRGIAATPSSTSERTPRVASPDPYDERSPVPPSNAAAFVATSGPSEL